MGNRIRELRKQKGITMKKLGHELGLAESTISQYETGRRDPDLKTLARLSEFFDVSIGYLLGNEKVRTPVRDPMNYWIDEDGNEHTEPMEPRPVELFPNPGGPVRSDNPISDEDLMFALWGGADEITPDMLDEVRAFAEFVRQRKAKEKPPQD